MSILQTSMLSTLGKLADWGTDTYKAARNAMKGMGQDSKYFASSKKGTLSWPRGRTVAVSYVLALLTQEDGCDKREPCSTPSMLCAGCPEIRCIVGIAVVFSVWGVPRC